ncbi:hypothetical protein E2562_038101 [Oryza meyeriana var. granulata]|uniref:DUF1677 family protein n=1 Tax=Oryza meyeriana var. granulata TaxID=110450 RepID=A0A6G1EU80_9ORYZ|nr:hypothetical protein E2562_038101 [Oryza meyeriana var. granulata]
MQILAVNTSLEPTKCFLLLSKNKDHQAELRRSYSECSNTTTAADQLVAGAVAASGGGSSDVETVRCTCCSVTEECTAAYIRRIRAAHCGDWVCGLCAEAVSERMSRTAATATDVADAGGSGGAAVEEALRSHMAVCRDFNSTTRLNPKLSLAGSMRDIARRSFNRRTSSSATTCHDQLRATKTMARTLSCQPRFLA